VFLGAANVSGVRPKWDWNTWAPLVPLFVPWTDLAVRGGFKPSAFYTPVRVSRCRLCSVPPYTAPFMDIVR